jgi:cytoskeletal protein RodZ
MASFGETLKRERELREISLRDIADATKINVRYLEALEHNRFEILPGGVFNKGFIRAYARFIGANGEALVDGYLQELAAREAAAAGAAPTPAHPGLHRPAEAPMRRSTDAQPSERRADPAPVAQPGILLGEPRPGAGGAAVIPIAGGALAGAANAADTASVDLQAPEMSSSRRLMPVMTIVGAAAVLLVLVVGARSFRESPTRDPQPPETPAVLTEPAAPQEAAASLPAPYPESNPAPAIENRPPADPTPREASADTPRRPAPPQPPPVQTAPPETRQVPAAVTPTAETREASATQEPPSPAPSGMEFRVEAASAVWVQVACDGEDRMNRSLQAGEGQTLRCLSLIRISATDAGAVRLFVNGVRCVPIGDPGTRVEGFAIRTEDYRAICPPGGASSHGRR